SLDFFDTEHLNLSFFIIDELVEKVCSEIQGQLTEQRAQLNEVCSFIKACGVMEQRVSEDIKRLKTHWENYGYQAPKDIHKTNKSEVEDKTGDENENKSTGEEEDTQEDAEVDHSSASPPALGAPPCADPLRTPQLSDFGLSEMQLKRALVGAEWCSEAPPMPEMSLPHPSLNTPALPPMAITPKRALRMDEDELLTPQMHDFGISEHTMCLNNDFTMDLRRKNVEKSQRQTDRQTDKPWQKHNLLGRVSSTDLESPEPPVFCTPGLKIKKTNGQCPQNPQENGDPESPHCHGNLATTPEVPEFKTPYMNRLVSTKKVLRTFVYVILYVLKLYIEKDFLKFDLNASCITDRPRNLTWETPCVRRVYEEPSTPEMPDLSSVTQDISATLSVVSENEFQGLPSYMRQMTLHSLNQAVQNINTFMTQCRGEQTEFQMEEMRKMINFGTKTPVFILCLTELKRLDHVKGARNTSVFKLNTHT
uniref:Spindle and kinetochore associated complex subunit 3 n=1 Tax=Sphaeramia orbicularis TaxID=375764 RepID=A0A673BHL7_9TELE